MESITTHEQYGSLFASSIFSPNSNSPALKMTPPRRRQRLAIDASVKFPENLAAYPLLRTHALVLSFWRRF